jgi:hypothetical protein
VKIALDVCAREEIDRVKLRFACEDCAMFDPEREKCAHGYPTHEHRAAHIDRGELVFCKDWDLA